MKDLQDQSVVIGTKQSLKYISAGKAEMVILAEDTDHHIAAEIRKMCQEHDVPLELCSSKKKLGRENGISRDAAVVTVLKSMSNANSEKR